MPFPKTSWIAGTVYIRRSSPYPPKSSSTRGISSNTYHFKAYVASAGTIFLVGTDNTQILAGTVIPQP